MNFIIINTISINGYKLIYNSLPSSIHPIPIFSKIHSSPLPFISTSILSFPAPSPLSRLVKTRAQQFDPEIKVEGDIETSIIKLTLPQNPYNGIYNQPAQRINQTMN